METTSKEERHMGRSRRGARGVHDREIQAAWWRAQEEALERVEDAVAAALLLNRHAELVLEELALDLGEDEAIEAVRERAPLSSAAGGSPAALRLLELLGERADFGAALEDRGSGG